MNQELLAQLLHATTSVELAQVIATHRLDIETIQALKEEMEQARIHNTAKGLQIAEAAYRLSLQLPAPAPSLGQWTLANALFYNGQYREAAQRYDLARSEYLSDGDSMSAARLGVGQVFVLAYIGEIPHALALANEIEPILTASSQQDRRDLQRLGTLLLNVGVVHELGGEFEEALEVYRRLLPIAQQLGNRYLLAEAHHNQAFALVQIGEFDGAIAAYAEAETLFVELNAHPDLVRLYTNQITLYSTLQRFAEARQAQAKANRLLTGMEGNSQQRRLVTLLGAWVEYLSDNELAADAFGLLQEAQQAFAHHGPLVAEGAAWIILGSCYLKQSAWQKAHHAFTQAHTLATQGADRTLAYRALHGLGQAAAGQHLLESAVAAFTAAIELIETIRQELYIEVFRSGFLVDKLVIYQDLVRVYLAQGQFSKAFQIIERAKSRLLTEKMSFRLHIEANQLAHLNDDTLRELSNALDTTLHELDQLYRQARQTQLEQSSALFAEPTAATLQAIITQEAQVQTLIHQIQRQRPVFSPFATGETVPLEQIQPLLGDALFLQYHCLGTEVWAFVIDQQGIQGYLQLAALPDILNAYQSMATACERALEMATNYGNERAIRHLPRLLADANKQLNLLYQQLFAPLAPYLPLAASLIIAPDGPLHHIPFHALYDGAAYLVEHHAISYTPSATLLNLCLRAHQEQSHGALFYGYDDQRLQAVFQELATLAQLLPGAEQQVGAMATTTHFLANAHAYRILHLATHAQFRRDKPMLSAITLADRRLTLAEVAQLHLNADLVVLSGCETGHGQLRGADLLSLAGGFLGAGARSLLVSLWRVEDQATALFMTHFYQALLAGATRTCAIQQAQMALLRQNEPTTPTARLYSHPAYWAPFALIGDWRTLPDLVSVAQHKQQTRP